jgi:hypothetical protein
MFTLVLPCDRVHWLSVPPTLLRRSSSCTEGAKASVHQPSGIGNRE